MNQQIPVSVPLIGQQDQRAAQQQAAINGKRLDTCAQILGHLLAIELAAGVGKAQQEAAIYPNEDKSPEVSMQVNVGRAVDIAMLATDEMFVRFGLLVRRAPDANGTAH